MTGWFVGLSLSAQIALVIVAIVTLALLIFLGLGIAACHEITREKSAPYPPGYKHPE